MKASAVMLSSVSRSASLPTGTIYICRNRSTECVVARFCGFDGSPPSANRPFMSSR